MAGQRVWYDDPPPLDQTISVVGPYLGVGLSVALTGLWLGCVLDLPGHDPLTCSIPFALLIVVVMRHRIRAAILAVR